jgi:hypothetical protein
MSWRLAWLLKKGLNDDLRPTVLDGAARRDVSGVVYPRMKDLALLSSQSQMVRLFSSRPNHLFDAMRTLVLLGFEVPGGQKLVAKAWMVLTGQSMSKEASFLCS